MEMISTAQLGCIKTLIGKLKVDGPPLIRGFSGMRTEHASDLYKTEAISLISHLKSLDPEEKKADVMRKKIIGMAYTRAGLARDASKGQKQAVVNWLNGWCEQYGYKHKKLNSYTYKELPKLVTQFEAVLNDLIITI